MFFVAVSTCHFLRVNSLMLADVEQCVTTAAPLSCFKLRMETDADEEGPRIWHPEVRSAGRAMALRTLRGDPA